MSTTIASTATPSQAVVAEGNHITVLNGDAYRALPRTPETWIVEHLLPTGGLFNLYGAPKGGKSWGALQLAVAIASGDGEWLTFPVHTHGPVLYLQLDTPRSLWAARLDAIAALGMDLSNVYFSDIGTMPYPFDILTEQTTYNTVGKITTFPCQAWLRAQVDAIKPVVVIIDTLRELHKGDENDSGQMANVMSALVAATSPSAVCLISHSRKENLALPENERENLLQDNRGSNYIAGRMDGIMRVSNKRLLYQSRTIDKHLLKCKRIEPGLWMVDRADEEAHIRAVLGDKTLLSISDRAEVLSTRTGKSIEACRSLLRRRSSVALDNATHSPSPQTPTTNPEDGI